MKESTSTLPWSLRSTANHAYGEPVRVHEVERRAGRADLMDLFAAGVYLDRVTEDAAGNLRFVQRLVVCDSSRFERSCNAIAWIFTVFIRAGTGTVSGPRVRVGLSVCLGRRPNGHIDRSTGG